MKELAQFVSNDSANVPRVSTAEGQKKGQKVIRLRRNGLQETHSFKNITPMTTATGSNPRTKS